MPNKRGAGKCSCCGGEGCPEHGGCQCGANDDPIGCFVITLSNAGEPDITCDSATANYCDTFFNSYGYYVVGCDCSVNGEGPYTYITVDSICCQVDSTPLGQVYAFYRLEFRPASTTSGTTLLRLAIGTTVNCYDCTESVEGTISTYVKMRVIIWAFENEVVDGCTQRKCTPVLVSDEVCCGYFDTTVQANVPYSQPDYPDTLLGCGIDVDWLDWSCPWSVFSTGTAIDCADANCAGYNISELECNLDDLIIEIEYITGSDMGAAYSGWADLCP